MRNHDPIRRDGSRDSARHARSQDPAPAPGGGAEADNLALLRGIATGSEEAFDRFYRRWAPRLGPFLIRVTGSTEAGEDLLQEAFLRILRSAPLFEPRGAVGGWVYRICANLAYSYWRRQRSSPLRPAGAPDRAARASEGPEARRLCRAFQTELSAALERLPANQRMVFLLKVDRGLTYQEIGQALQCPEGTAKSRFHHAVLRLRGQLEDWSGGLLESSSLDAAALLRRPSDSSGGSRHDL